MIYFVIENMKTQDSKRWQLSIRDLKSIAAYIVLFVGPQLAVLIPQLRDVLMLYMPLEWVALILATASSIGMVLKKLATDYSKKNG